MFTPRLREHLDGTEDVARQTAHARRNRVYERTTEALQKDMPLLLEAIEEGRIDADDLAADLPAGGEGGRELFITAAMLLYDLAAATEGVDADEVLDQAAYNRRAESAQEVFDRLMANPDSQIRGGELKLLREAGWITEEERKLAFYEYFEPGPLTGSDLTDIITEARSDD